MSKPTTFLVIDPMKALVTSHSTVCVTLITQYPSMTLNLITSTPGNEGVKGVKVELDRPLSV